MTDFQKDVVKILIQYGLLALFVAAFAAYASRALERLKTGLGWSSEMLKQSLLVASDVAGLLDELAESYRQLIGIRLLKDIVPQDRLDRFRDAERKVLGITLRSAIVFPETPEVVTGLRALRSTTFMCVEKWCLRDPDSPVPDSTAVLSAEIARVDRAVEAILETLTTRFSAGPKM
jgi:hypothetical protein